MPRVSRWSAIAAVAVVVVGVLAALTASPDRVLRVEARERQGLRVGDQVLILGATAGRVSGVARQVLATGTNRWSIQLALNPSARRLPLDTTAELCMPFADRAAHIELRPGAAKQVFRNGGVLPAAQTSTPRAC